jgi:excisionase family DNA binding protein
MKTWFTVSEGAEYAGVSRDTIYTACERRELHHARIGGRRSIRLKPEWIDAWLEQHARGTIVSRANARGGSDHGTDRANA